jgi:hypothetical protein
MGRKGVTNDRGADMKNTPTPLPPYTDICAMQLFRVMSLTKSIFNAQAIF